MRRLSALIATAVVASLALSACGDDKPQGAERPTPSNQPSPSATATDASVGLTKAPSKESARHFIRRWVELGNQMQQTGEASGYLDVAGPDCAPCHAFADRVVKIYKNGGSIDGGKERVVALSPESPTQWLLTTKVEPTTYREKAGAKRKTYKGGRDRSRLFLAKVDGAWIVGDFETVD